jgi:F-type H+-transporting ATPase subunit delta
LREPTIARNYAEALFEVGERSGQTVLFADLIDAVAGAIDADERVKVVLESPRVTKHRKQDLLARALAGRAPDTFVKFLAAVIRRGRQGIFRPIADEYLALVDVKFNRVHASITLARTPDLALQSEIQERLSAILAKEVVPHYHHEPKIMGGVIVRVGDRVMDGSIRRRMQRLRSSMLSS